MAEAKLNVQLIGKTGNALEVIYAACRQCYSAEFAGEIFDRTVGADDTGKIGAFIKKVIASGHESPLEHVKFTFAAEGISRALTHQLVRHRMASYSQQSQRYVKGSDFGYIIPPAFKKDDGLKTRFISMMEKNQEAYNELIELLESKGVKGELANQDARFVLPQSAETKIVITMNCRELKHFFETRCCRRAQWEIRALADEMLGICAREVPDVFETAGAKCEALGYCPESETMTCGRVPLKKDVLK